MKCPVVSLGVSMDLVWLWAAFLLAFRVAFLFFWRMCAWCLVLEFVGSLVELGLRISVEASGLAFVYKCSLGSGIL